MPFKPGQSGNPGGRTGVPKAVRELSRQFTEESVERLVFWMRSDHPTASPAAADKLLDRGWGKPSQPIDGDGEGGPIRIARIERTIIDPAPRPAIKLPE